MIRLVFRSRLLLAFALCFFGVAAYGQFWVTGYYPGTVESSYPIADIDFSTLTHVIHFAAVPNPDGSLNLDANSISRVSADELIGRAHSAGRKVLLCLGGADTEAVFRKAADDVHRAAFISNIDYLVSSWGYDGLDLDWEPLAKADFASYTNLVGTLRARLGRKILTAAISAYPIYGDPSNCEYLMFAALQSNFDQINIMTYDLSGPYDGWITWYNSPLRDGGCRFRSTHNLVPSLDGAVRGFLSCGVNSCKLGIGIPFYGTVWTGGVSGPRQTWSSAPKFEQLSYSEIMSRFYRTNDYHWDAAASVPYLSVDPPGREDAFVSFDDPRSCEAKVRYARLQHLGGVMIWHLGDDFQPELQSGRQPLVQAIARALAATNAP